VTRRSPVDSRSDETYGPEGSGHLPTGYRLNSLRASATEKHAGCARSISVRNPQPNSRRSAQTPQPQCPLPPVFPGSERPLAHARGSDQSRDGNGAVPPTPTPTCLEIILAVGIVVFLVTTLIASAGCASAEKKDAGGTPALQAAATRVAPETTQTSTTDPVTTALAELKTNQGTLTSAVTSLTKTVQESTQATGGVLAELKTTTNKIAGDQQNLDQSVHNNTLSPEQLKQSLAETEARRSADSERTAAGLAALATVVNGQKTTLDQLSTAVQTASDQTYKQQDVQIERWRGYFAAVVLGVIIPLVLLGVAIYVADEAGASPYVKMGALVFAAVMGAIIVLTLLGTLWSFIGPVLGGRA
jgi:hypothetical protein